MKRLLFPLFIFIFLFLAGCAKDNLVAPPESGSNQTGSVMLKMNGGDIPSQVAAVTSYLINSVHDTLTSSVASLSDSSASISFNGVQAGQWLLKIIASDNSGNVIYSGEKDITVLAGVTTYVDMTLLPVASGSGNIVIRVSWGSNQNSWIDISENPVFTPSQNPTSPNSVTQGKIIFDNGVFNMWYTSLYNSAVANIWYAQSSDGVHWHNVVNYPVLTTGQYGSWDDYSVGAGAVIKDGSGYKMYYNGFRDQYGTWSIGLATSPDGTHWQKYPSPVLTPSQNENQIGASDVIKVNNIYYLYYSTRNYPYYSISVATSADGIHWEKVGSNPVITATLEWEGTGVYSPSVVYDNGSFEMVYMNAAANSFGMAVSNDGLNWIKDSGNPFFTISNTYGVWSSSIAYPNFHKFGSEEWIYYTGYTINTGEIALIKKYN